MIFELWRIEHEDGSIEESFGSRDDVAAEALMKSRGETFVWSVEATNYDEAHRLLHIYKGWDPYIPFE